MSKKERKRADKKTEAEARQAAQEAKALPTAYDMKRQDKQDKLEATRRAQVGKGGRYALGQHTRFAMLTSGIMVFG